MTKDLVLALLLLEKCCAEDKDGRLRSSLPQHQLAGQVAFWANWWNTDAAKGVRQDLDEVQWPEVGFCSADS